MGLLPVGSHWNFVDLYSPASKSTGSSTLVGEMTAAQRRGTGGAGTSPRVLASRAMCVVCGFGRCNAQESERASRIRTVQLVWKDALEGLHLVGLLLGVIFSGDTARAQGVGRGSGSVYSL